MGHSHSVVCGHRALAGWAGVGIVLMILGSPTWAAEKKKSGPKTETRIREINVYSGTIKAIDPKNYTITVDGQIQTITEEIEVKKAPKKKGVISTRKSKPKTGSSANTAQAKPASGSRTFLILGGSKILKAERQLAVLGDLQVGQPVEVTFREVDDNRFVAEVIAPPGANPDRPQSTSSRVARESNIFTGTIKAIDLKLSTITVFGTVRPGAKSGKPAKTTSAKQKAAPAALNSEPRLFLVLGGCKILRADWQLGMLGNLKVGQQVEVMFREVDDEKFVAELIAPPSPKSAK